MEDKEAYENLVKHAKAVEIEVKKERTYTIARFSTIRCSRREIDRLTVLKEIDPIFWTRLRKKRLDEMAEIEEQANRLAKRKKSKRIAPEKGED